jgi:murein DD-endopeptidase MepM/ murein hydrolase activator NlpD
MANPKARGGFLRRLSTPPGVMVATTALVFLSLSDHRAASNTDPADAVSRGAAVVVGAPALPATPSGAVASSVAEEASGARPRDRLVVASIRPERGLVEALMPGVGGPGRPGGSPAAAAAVMVAKLDTAKEPTAASDVQPQTLRDWDGDAFVGPLPPAATELPVSATLPEGSGDLAVVAAQPVAIVSGISADADAAAPLASVGQKLESHRHPLGFDPLSEPALAGSGSEKSTAATKGLAELLATEEEHTVRYVRDVVHEVRSGETLSTVLSREGVGSADAARWLAAVRKQYNPNRIYAGQTITLSIDMPDKRLRRMKFDIGRGGSLVVDDDGAGTTLVAKQKAPSAATRETNIRVVEGQITSSLYATASAKGVPDRIISDAAEVLGWEINLGRDLQPGSRFRLAYEETIHVDTRESWAGKLLAVELSNQGKHYEGFYFATPDGKTSGYYNRKGQGLGRAFLRYPVSFSRISSQFSSSRYHPVLKRSKPHYGVDFAAPTGTPVKAAADGVVSVAGWQGGNGRFVKIRHDKQYESGYSHLSRIASGMRPGVRVKQGQVIGYVGSTGLATGPHLHFAMYSYGKYVDPMKTSLPRTMPLSGTSLASFKSGVSKVEKVYAANGMGPFGAPKIATAAAPTTTRR